MPDSVALALTSRLPQGFPKAETFAYKSGNVYGAWNGTSATDGTRMLLWGGQISTSQALSNQGTFLLADGVTRSYLPNSGVTPNVGMGCTYVAGKFYLTAGHSFSTPGNYVSAYTPAGTDGISGSWSTPAAMPYQVAFHSLASLNGVFYSCGGSSNNSGVSSGGQAYFYRYDPAANTWTARADMPVGISQGNALAYNGKIYYIAGITGSGAYPGKVYSYDPTANTWSTSASTAPVSMTNGWAVVVGNTFWWVPGMTAGDASRTNIYIYTPATDSWSVGPATTYTHGLGPVAAVIGSKLIVTQGNQNANAPLNAVTTIDVTTWTDQALPPALPQQVSTAIGSRYGMQVGSDGTVAYITGGWTDGTNGLASGYAYQPSNGSLAVMTNGPGKANAAYAFGVGRLWSLGGQGGSNQTPNGSWSYTPAGTLGASGTWAQLPSQPTNTNFGCAAVIGNFLYYTGGVSTAGYSGTPTTALQRYDISAGTWSTITSAPMPVGRSNPLGVAYNGRFLVIGGYDPNAGFRPQAYAFDPATTSWSQLPDMPTNLGTPAGACVANNYVYVLLQSGVMLRWDGATWTQAQSPAQTHVNGGAWQGSLVAVGNQVLIVAGPGSNGAIDSIDATAISPYGRRIRSVQQYLTATNPVAGAAARKITTGIPVYRTQIQTLLADSRSIGAPSCDGTRYYYTGGNYYSGSSQFPTDGFTLTAAGVRTTISANDPAVQRALPGGANLGGVHYGVGGAQGSSLTGGTDTAVNSVTAYTPAGTNGAGGSWTSKANLPAVRVAHGIAVAAGYLWVAGGRTTYGTTSAINQNTLYRYDPTGNVWATMATIPNGLYDAVLLPYNGKLYFYKGGQTTQIYDIASNTWSNSYAAGNVGPANYNQGYVMIGSTCYYSSGTILYAMEITTGVITSSNSNFFYNNGQAAFAAIGKTVFAANAGTAEIFDPTVLQQYVGNIAQTKALVAIAA